MSLASSPQNQKSDSQRHRPAKKRSLRQRPASRRLTLEPLEERSLMAYDIFDLGTIGAVALNNVDQVAANVGGHAALWDNGTVTDLGTLGGISSRANDVNDAGQVVGYADTPTGIRHAFLVTPEDSNNDGQPDRWFRDDDLNGINDLLLDLGTLGGPASEARGINNLGQVVGRADLSTAAGSYRAFLWDSAAGMQNLGEAFAAPPGGANYVIASEANAVNDAGQVVGTTYQLLGGWNLRGFQSFRWDPISGGSRLSSTGWGRDKATGINNAGQIVGNSGNSTANCTLCPITYHVTDAFLWQDGATTGLGFTNPGQLEFDVSINQHAQVVGRGYLWQEGARIDLNASVDPLLGWGNLIALDINDAAQIVGQGTHEGVSTSFLLSFDTPSLPPTISIADISVNEGNAGAVERFFTVNLSRAIDTTVTVDFNTAAGSATAGVDFLAMTSGTLTIAPGQISQTVSVSVVGDTRDEYDETFFVNLTSATAAAIADAQAVGTIIDDDGPPALFIGDVTMSEGNSGQRSFVFTVNLSAASDNAISVSFATANGTARTGNNDYEAKSGTLTFAPGEIFKTITVVVNGDRRVEAVETFFVNLTSATNATLADAQGVGTILNDDVARSANRADLANMARHFGVTSGATTDQGDWNGDGAVNVADLALLQANFALPAPSPVAAPAALITPVAAAERSQDSPRESAVARHPLRLTKGDRHLAVGRKCVEHQQVARSQPFCSALWAKIADSLADRDEFGA